MLCACLGCAAEPVTNPTFESDVSPVLQQKCGPCHTTDLEGGLNHALVYADTQFDSEFCEDKKVYECMLVLVQSGEMPEDTNCSGDAQMDEDNDKCFTMEEQELLRLWIMNGAPP